MARRRYDVHRKAIDKHQRAIRESLKCLFDGLDDDDEPADDPTLIEAEAGDGDMEGMSMLLSDLKALAEQAQELAW